MLGLDPCAAGSSEPAYLAIVRCDLSVVANAKSTDRGNFSAIPSIAISNAIMPGPRGVPHRVALGEISRKSMAVMRCSPAYSRRVWMGAVSAAGDWAPDSSRARSRSIPVFVAPSRIR